MNENQGGTPNPLNPNPLDANPSEPMEGAKPMPAQPAPQPRPQMRPRPMQPLRPTQPAPAPRPQPQSQPLTEELVEESVMVDSLDPNGRPMEQVAGATPVTPKKKKTGLIVGLIICLFVAVGCGVAAVLMLMNPGKDPVAAAVKKLMSGEVPSYVSVSGSISIDSTDTSTPISNARIDLDSNINTSSIANSTNLSLVLTTDDNKQSTYNLSEIASDDKDVYIKIEKEEEPELLESENLLNSDDEVLDEEGEASSDAALIEEDEALVTTNCETDEASATNCVTEEEDLSIDGLAIYDSIIESLGGDWLRISLADMESVEESDEGEAAACLTDALDGLKSSRNGFAELYDKNPFVSSTTDNIPVNSKTSTVHRLDFDDEKLTEFVNGALTIQSVNKVFNCMGSSKPASFSASDISNILSKLPAIYAEVTPDNDFSRIYTKFTTDDETMTVTVDLSFKYPTSLTVQEPEDYKDLTDAIQEIFSSSEENASNATVIDVEAEE